MISCGRIAWKVPCHVWKCCLIQRSSLTSHKRWETSYEHDKNKTIVHKYHEHLVATIATNFSRFENILSIQTRASMPAKEGLMEQDSHNASKKASITKKIPPLYASHRAQDYLPKFLAVVHVRFNGFHSTEVEPILPPRIYAWKRDYTRYEIYARY